MIVIDSLYKRYRNSRTHALQDVSLHIKTGEIYGLLGTNGAGKTTLFSVICGLRKISKGRIIIDGLDLKNHSAQIKTLIGVVPQDIALFPALSVYENLRFFGRMYGMERRELDERITYLLNDFELTESRDKPVKTRSGGMKRRINLIAGILHRPKILILDEPTVGIDAHTAKQIMQHLKVLNSEGTTILYTSHYLKDAQLFCHRTGILEEGKLIEEGQPDYLIKKYNKNNLEEAFLSITNKKN